MSRKKPITIKIVDKIEVYPDAIYEKTVKKTGNGAAIPFYKKYIGDEVIVIVKEEIKTDDVIPTDRKLSKKIADRWEDET